MRKELERLIIVKGRKKENKEESVTVWADDMYNHTPASQFGMKLNFQENIFIC